MLFSCTNKKDSLVPLESTIVSKSIKIIEEIKRAYINNDKTTLKSLTTPDGYSEIFANPKNFDSAELSFTTNWIDIKDKTVNFYIAWIGKWTKKGKAFDERGLAIFILTEDPPRLKQIMRANPFIYPE